MDVKATYTAGPYRIVLGWLDSKQDYFARIETDTADPEMKWEYETPQGFRGYSILEMLAYTQIAARDIIGLEQFEVSEYDLQQLTQAPNSRLLTPSELQPLNMLDTDYAKAPIYGHEEALPEIAPAAQLPYDEFLHIIDYGGEVGPFSDDAPIEDLEQMVVDCLAELETCASCLKTFIEAAQQPDSAVTQERLNSQCTNAITFTAGQLVQINESLFRSFSLERIGEIAHASEDITATLDEIYTPEEIESINTVAVMLCGSKLSAFQTAIERRGYDPVTGVPIGCLNPASFNWSETVEDADIAVHLQ